MNIKHVLIKLILILFQKLEISYFPLTLILMPKGAQLTHTLYIETSHMAHFSICEKFTNFQFFLRQNVNNHSIQSQQVHTLVTLFPNIK